MIAVCGLLSLMVYSGQQDPLFAAKQAELPEILEPSSLALHRDRLFIAESASVLVYGLPDYKMQKKFLETGEGPGEVRLSINLAVFPKQLLVNCPGKAIFFTHAGEFIEEIKVPFEIQDFYPIGTVFVGSMVELKSNPGESRQLMYLFNKKMAVLKELYRGSTGSLTLVTTGNGRKQDIEMIKDVVAPFVYKNRVYIADTTKGLFISVFDDKGEKLYDIDKPYRRYRVRELYIRRERRKIRQSPRWERVKDRFNYITSREYFPAFKYVRFANNRIYLIGHARRLNRCDITVLDLSGNILKQSAVPDTHLFTVNGNDFIYLWENDEKEVWELHTVSF